MNNSDSPGDKMPEIQIPERLSIYEWPIGSIVIDKWFDRFEEKKVMGYDDETGQIQLGHHNPPGGGSYYVKPEMLVIAKKCNGDIDLWFKMRDQLYYQRRQKIVKVMIRNRVPLHHRKELLAAQLTDN